MRVSTCRPKLLERCRTLFPEHDFSRLKHSFELKIKGDLMPEAAAEEIIGELQALFARHNAEAARSANAVPKPTKEFHTARHRNNFELGMLNFEFSLKRFLCGLRASREESPSDFSFPVSAFSLWCWAWRA